MLHDFVDLFLDVHHGTLGQMHINKCGGNTLMAQQCLNYSQMDAGLQEMSGIRVPQRVAAYVLVYIALPQGCLEAALHAVGGNGLGAFLGGKKPYLRPVLQPVESQLGQYLDRQRHGSIPVAFGVSRPDDHALTVNIIKAKIHALGDPQAARVHQRQTHVWFGAADQIQ